jgi:hypothetical protein
MALSMDEQRVLAEIERRLAADDPGLATCMTSFRRPGPATVLRSPRARIIGSLFTVLLVAMVSLMVYAMIPFRAHGTRTPAAPSTGSQGKVVASTGPGYLPASTAPVSAAAGTGLRTPGKSANPSADVSASPVTVRGAKSQAAGHAAPTAAGP